jgi:hypothetical protein
MNKQEFIINTLKPYFLDKNTCAVEDGKCSYRTSDGKKCAVGKYIPDSKYWDGIELKVLEEVLPFVSSEVELSLQEWKLVRSVHDDLGLGFPTASLRGLAEIEVWSKVDLTELKELASLT